MGRKTLVCADAHVTRQPHRRWAPGAVHVEELFDLGRQFDPADSFGVIKAYEYEDARRKSQRKNCSWCDNRHRRMTYFQAGRSGLLPDDWKTLGLDLPHIP